MGRQIYGSPPVVTVQGTLTTLQSQAGRQPSQPTITSPTSGATLSSFTPTLSSSAFFVYNTDTHAGSQWQFANDSAFVNVVYDLATTASKTSLTVSSGAIAQVSGPLYARVRYISSASEVSPWSNAISMNRAASVAVTPQFLSTTNYRFTFIYSGTGTADSVSVKISASADMSNPIANTSVTLSGNTGNLDAVTYASMPGYSTGTPYYVQVTSLGAGAIVSTATTQLAQPTSSLALNGSSAVYNPGSASITVFNNVTGANSASIATQYSTSVNFTTVAYESTSSSIAATNLPGLSNRASSYYCRFVVVAGSDRPVVGSPFALTAVQVLTGSGSGSISSAYSGAVLVSGIGGGGSGAGAPGSACGGGGSGYINSQTYTVTAGQSFSYAVGAGGNGPTWADGNPGSATTFTLGGTTLTCAGGSGGRSQGSSSGGTGGRNGGDGVGSGTGNYGGGGSPYNSGGAPGKAGSDAVPGYGGYGGYGYGAGGGGAVRSADYGGTGPAGGGAGGWPTGPQAGQGQFANVVAGGNGNVGYLQIQYTNW